MSFRLVSLFAALCWSAAAWVASAASPFSPLWFPALLGLAALGLLPLLAVALRRGVPASVLWLFGRGWPASLVVGPRSGFAPGPAWSCRWAPAGAFRPLWRGRVLLLFLPGGSAWSPPVRCSVLCGGLWVWRARVRAAFRGCRRWWSAPGWRPLLSLRRRGFGLRRVR